ncbi:MAG: hypothetical protein AB7E36_17750 [Salinivirgaceae bacterium]
MITNFIKFIVSVFLSIVATILIVLWLGFGTLLLIALLIRLISLYTIALLNSFTSGVPLIHDYPKAIEEAIDMYISTYRKLLSLPLLPWKQTQLNEDNNKLRALLPTELDELKKSWAITVIVFASYILSLSMGMAYYIQRNNHNADSKYQPQIVAITDTLKNYQLANYLMSQDLQSAKQQQIVTISNLYRYWNYSIISISKIMGISPEEVRQIIEENDISK